MASTPVFLFNAAQETASWEENLQQQEMTSNSMHTHNVDIFSESILVVNPMLDRAKGMGFVLSPLIEVPLMVVGRLAKFVNTWEVLTQDSWVLQTVRGFQIPFVGQPVQHQRPAIPCFPLEQLAQIQEEISSLREKGAISVVADPSHSQKQTRVLFESVPRPQEEWEYEASDKSESPEPVGGNSLLQNEGAANSSRPAEAGRLASQGGLERCLLHGSSPPRPPPLLEVCDRRGDLPVHLPSIWASWRPLGVHQVDEDCGDSSQVMGVQDDYLHR